jgi:hypothetical protein
MASGLIKSARFAVAASLAILGTSCASTMVPQPVQSPVATKQAPAPAVQPDDSRLPLRTLIVGGGPTRASNQVAIESNVRYVGRLLPDRSSYRVLFADGERESVNVQFRAPNGTLAYRAPDLPRLDGSADLPGVRAALTAVATEARTLPQSPVLLYFTGHGSPDRRSGHANNWFSLWGGGRFTVAELARSLEAFPPSTPITLVMVQCFSGAFGNVLFEKGDPKGALIEQRVAGFFAAVPDRLSAGCTPAINEAEYKDFTGYFFAALTGQDRMGRPVTGADYNQDRRVGLNEAFAWTLVHDDSIDTPVCTSDMFLRRFVTMADEEIFALSFRTLRSWASPAQQAALDGLSSALGISSDDRLRIAFSRFTRLRPASRAPSNVRLIRLVELTRSVALAHTLDVSGDETTKRRFAELLLAEQRNPLR